MMTAATTPEVERKRSTAAGPSGPWGLCRVTSHHSVGQSVTVSPIAVDQANEAGDVPCELTLVEEDSQGNPDQAPPLAQSLVENEELVAVAGPYFSGETLAVGEIFSESGVLFTGTGTNETIDEQGYETWFRSVAPDNIQGEVAADYIANALGGGTVAVVHDNQDYSKGLADAVFKNLGERRGSVRHQP